MCGIAGFVSHRNGGSLSQLKSIAAAMNDSIRHRGPDDDGVFLDADAGVALVHRRLSIVDLSPAGHQPMESADGRYVIIYNGEVYSHEEIRPSLTARGVKFRGHSDTEVIVESIAQFGLEATLPNLIGMFAIALWDRRERTLTLVRDRLGIKPLYWAQFGDLFLFGSEMKALRAHPGWSPRINHGAVSSFMRYSYVPGPMSIYEGVNKLQPGTVLTLPYRGEPRIEAFWDAQAAALEGLASPLRASDDELTEQLHVLLRDAVRRRMIADVPLGAFLSGGIDSATVVALMQATSNRQVKTYSIGFDIADYNEAPHAAALARHIGTDHTEMMVTAQEALNVLPRLPEWFDEPFADSSQIPTYLVSALARRHVTVALSGDGGDELFAGYNRYRLTQRAWAGLSLAPQTLRSGVASMLTSVSADRWSRMLSFLPEQSRPAHVGDKIHKMASVLCAPDGDAVYQRLITHWEPAEIRPHVAEAKGIVWDTPLRERIPNLLDRMQFLDLVTYLPDDILTKVDRASMAVALEVRVPLLDHRLVEFSWRLPRSAKIRNGETKWLLRRVLDRYAPRDLAARPKLGFGIPLGKWLRGPLRDWAEVMLDERRLRTSELVDPQQVRRVWKEHLSGRANREYLLWDILMLEAWREQWA